jgi:hypothetical protein
MMYFFQSLQYLLIVGVIGGELFIAVRRPRMIRNARRLVANDAAVPAPNPVST